MDILEITLGQIPEALYFALFMIFTNEIKTKRVCFIASTILEYVLIFNAFPYNNWAHILFLIALFLIMKLFYKDKCQVTDIFTMGIASIILCITSVILYFIVWALFNNYMVYVIIHRILLFTILFLLKPKLNKLHKLYHKLWNRNDKIKKPIKATTFRSLNLVVFNFMFYLINAFIVYGLTINGM